MKIFKKRLFLATYLLVYLYIFITKLIKYGKINIFDSINIETTSICNRRCQFCPVNYYPRKRAEMDQKLFSKIINELAKIKFFGRISLHSYNEPLLDKRIVNLIKEIRQKCPRAFIVIYSNGDLINLELFDQLINAGMNLLHVTQYDKTINNELQTIINKRQNLITIKKLQPADICNRAGALKNIKKSNYQAKPCFLPAKQLVINVKGEVILCCNDYFAQEVMGNCRQDNLVNIWQNKKFNKFRNCLKRGGRSIFKLCRHCDYRPTFKTWADQEIFSYGNLPLLKYYEKIIFVNKKSHV